MSTSVPLGATLVKSSMRWGFCSFDKKADLGFWVHSLGLVLQHTAVLKQTVGLVCKLRTSAKMIRGPVRRVSQSSLVTSMSLVVIFL